MQRNLDTEAAIIINDLDSMCLRIDGLQAHPRYTDALNLVRNARQAIVDGRGEVHQREMKARFAAQDCGRPVPAHGSGP